MLFDICEQDLFILCPLSFSAHVELLGDTVRLNTYVSMIIVLLYAADTTEIRAYNHKESEMIN